MRHLGTVAFLKESQQFPCPADIVKQNLFFGQLQWTHYSGCSNRYSELKTKSLSLPGTDLKTRLDSASAMHIDEANGVHIG